MAVASVTMQGPTLLKRQGINGTKTYLCKKSAKEVEMLEIFHFRSRIWIKQTICCFLNELMCHKPINIKVKIYGMSRNEYKPTRFTIRSFTTSKLTYFPNIFSDGPDSGCCYKHNNMVIFQTLVNNWKDYLISL